MWEFALLTSKAFESRSYIIIAGPLKLIELNLFLDCIGV